MKTTTITKTKKAHKELEKAILNTNTLIRQDYVIEIYRYWAKIDAIENALIKKGLLKKEDILIEKIPILKEMKKDFK
ncbi:hypothetical protein ACFL1H_01730 [Nanoarchaeota archaeon]